MNRFMECNLQLFADGGEGGYSAGVAEGSASYGATEGQVAADNGVNATDNSQADAEREANFKSMINSPEYKDIYAKHFEKAMGRRLKGKDKQIADLNGYKDQVAPLLDKLAIKYGVRDASDIESILQAADEDTSYYEDYALKHGVDIETAKQLLKAEKITADYERRQQEERDMAEFQEQYQAWMDESYAVQQYYPDFDFETEAQNVETGDNFMRLVTSGVPIKMAYEVVHHNESIGGAMQFAYNQARQEMADARTARQQRPLENGISGQQASAITEDVSKLSLKDIRKIQAAVSRGEKVNNDNIRQFLK